MVTPLDCFHLKIYRVDSIENLSLMFLLKFMYSIKFTGRISDKKTFAYAYRGLVSVVIKMGLAQMLGAREILKILNYELGMYAYRDLVSVVIKMGLEQMLGAREILKILNYELGM